MNFIGMDLHKHVCIAVAIGEEDRVVAECDDLLMTKKGLDGSISYFDPNNRRIVFYDPVHAHLVSHHLYLRGYVVDVAHTCLGALDDISNHFTSSSDPDGAPHAPSAVWRTV